MTDYFIDSSVGSDLFSGTSPLTPWQTLTKVNAQTFSPGDTINFQGGQTFTGTLTLAQSGTSGSPVIVQSYGTGQATINITTAANNGILLTDLAWVTIQNLILTGPGVNASGTGASTGIGLYSHYTATTTGPTFKQGLKFLNLTISGFKTGILCDANGSNVAPIGVGAGPSTPNVQVGYDGLEIGNVTVANAGFVGILVWYQSVVDPPPGSIFWKNTNVHDCVAHDVYGYGGSAGGGGGIFLASQQGFGHAPTDTPVITRCVGHDNGIRNTDLTGGGGGGVLFGDSCSACKASYCESYNNQGNIDGVGFDADENCVDCVFEYCYSHDNQGSAFLSYNSTRTIFRWCLSVNDANHIDAVIRSSNSAAGTIVHNCTIYTTNALAVTDYNGAKMYNNAMYFIGTFIGPGGGGTTSTPDLFGNVYWANGSPGQIFASYPPSTTRSVQTLAQWQSNTGNEIIGGTGYGSFAAWTVKNMGGHPTALPGSPVTSVTDYTPTSTTGLLTAVNLSTQYGITIGTVDFNGSALPSFSFAGAVSPGTNGYSKLVSGATVTITAATGAFSGEDSLTIATSAGAAMATAVGGTITGNGTSSVTVTPAEGATSFTFVCSATCTVTITNGQGWTDVSPFGVTVGGGGSKQVDPAMLDLMCGGALGIMGMDR